MTVRTCGEHECQEKFYARNRCRRHYRKAFADGTLNVLERTPAERFWEKVDRRGDAECWPWTGAIGSGGYGNFFAEGSYCNAHRFSYELNVGPIPAGLQIDHVSERGCEGKSCVNPAHLEPVTGRENVLRAPASIPAINLSRSHCPQGHAYDVENTYITSTGSRQCRACHRTRERELSRRRSLVAA